MEVAVAITTMVITAKECVLIDDVLGVTDSDSICDGGLGWQQKLVTVVVVVDVIVEVASTMMVATINKIIVMDVIDMVADDMDDCMVDVVVGS